MNADERALLDDDTLFDAWRDGDLAAANILVHRHERTVRRYLARRVGQHLDDATQNVWTAIARSHDRFERRGSFRAYLLGVLRNQTFEVQRQLVRARKHDAVDDSLSEPRPSVETLIELREAHQRLEVALASLNADTRRVIDYYYFERLTARAMGQRLGIGERTARSRVRRALDRLRFAMACARQKKRGPPGEAAREGMPTLSGQSGPNLGFGVPVEPLGSTRYMSGAGAILQRAR
jgi:RNA polymerase sigma factor (sigma-70 family)